MNTYDQAMETITRLSLDKKLAPFTTKNLFVGVFNDREAARKRAAFVRPAVNPPKKKFVFFTRSGRATS